MQELTSSNRYYQCKHVRSSTPDCQGNRLLKQGNTSTCISNCTAVMNCSSLLAMAPLMLPYCVYVQKLQGCNVCCKLLCPETLQHTAIAAAHFCCAVCLVCKLYTFSGPQVGQSSEAVHAACRQIHCTLESLSPPCCSLRLPLSSRRRYSQTQKRNWEASPWTSLWSTHLVLGHKL